MIVHGSHSDNLYWIYAFLLRNQPCRDYVLREALFGKIWWEEAQKHFNGPGLGSSPEEDVRKVKITGEGYNADTFHFQHLARHKSTLTNPFSLQLILRLPLPLASPTPSISCFSADLKGGYNVDLIPLPAPEVPEGHKRKPFSLSLFYLYILHFHLSI